MRISSCRREGLYWGEDLYIAQPPPPDSFPWASGLSARNSSLQRRNRILFVCQTCSKSVLRPFFQPDWHFLVYRLRENSSFRYDQIFKASFISLTRLTLHHKRKHSRSIKLFAILRAIYSFPFDIVLPRVLRFTTASESRNEWSVLCPLYERI